MLLRLRVVLMLARGLGALLPVLLQLLLAHLLLLLRLAWLLCVSRFHTSTVRRALQLQLQLPLGMRPQLQQQQLMRHQLMDLRKLFPLRPALQLPQQQQRRVWQQLVQVQQARPAGPALSLFAAARSAAVQALSWLQRWMPCCSLHSHSSRHCSSKGGGLKVQAQGIPLAWTQLQSSQQQRHLSASQQP
jgi:hypothetical protein